MNIEDLSLKEKIGQMFIISLKQNGIDESLISMITDYKIGGVILYRKNYATYKEMIEIVNKIKQINSKNKIPIFISIDQEGGRVNRFPSEVKNIKSATKLAKFIKENDETTLKNVGKLMGEMLRKTGINLNYAPVLDIKRFEDQHPIGDRCYSNNPQEVAKLGIQVMKGIQEEKVIPAIKHFPGHGTTKTDSHFFIPKSNQTLEIIEKEDIYPFKEAIAEGADAIMIGHLIIKELDKKYPASLSENIIHKYLDNFKGLIITDDMKMVAIRLNYNLKFAVQKAIESGNDIVMIGIEHEKIKSIIDNITKKVKKGIISNEKINTSVTKIISMKEKYNITDEMAKGFNVQEINEKIDKLNEMIE